MFQLPFVPAHKLAAALEEIETLKQERDDQAHKAAEARRDATTLVAERDRLADDVERLKAKLERLHETIASRDAWIDDLAGRVNAAVNILSGEAAGMVAVSKLLAAKDD